MRKIFYFIISLLTFCSQKEINHINVKIYNSDKTIHFEQLQDLRPQKEFTLHGLDSFQIGFSNSPVWLELSFKPQNQSFLYIKINNVDNAKLLQWNSPTDSWMIHEISSNENFFLELKDLSHPIFFKIVNTKETNLVIGYENFENLISHNNAKNAFTYFFLSWNFIVFITGVALCFVYRELYYLYLSAFEILFFLFFYEHNGLLNFLFNFSLFPNEKIKFLFLLFSGYAYFLFVYRFFHKEKSSLNKLKVLVGIILFGIFLTSLVLKYDLVYKVWMSCFLGFIVLSFIPIFYARKFSTFKTFLFGLVSFLVIIQQNILFFSNLGYFILVSEINAIINFLNFAHNFLIIIIISIEARQNVNKRILTEKNLHELEIDKLEIEKKFLELEKVSIEEKAKLNFAKNEFLKKLALDLKTPLINMINIIDLLQQDTHILQNKYVNKEVQNIFENAKLLLDSLQNLSDFSLLETNSIILNKTQIDLNNLIDLSILSLSQFSNLKNIKIVNQTPKDLLLIEGDEERLLQAMHNLLFQVIENCSSNLIEIDTNLVPGYIKLKIKYSGNAIKIPNLTNSSILDLIQQETYNHFNKLLNLAVASKILKLSGGKIYSKEDKEFSLVIFFPISHNQNRSTFLKSVKKKNWLEFYVYPNSITNTFQFLNTEPERILVVDSEIISLNTIESILSAYDYKPILVNSTQVALEEIHKEKPDLILVDLFMPNISGYKFCQLVRELYDKNELPILLFIFSSDLEEIKELFNLVNDTIIKPFTKEKLISKVRSAIKLSKMNQAYKRFVPMEFIGLLNKKDISELKLGDYTQKRMSILFSDIRNYTQLSEKMKPEENFIFLNSYLKKIGPIIRNNRGFIDKYIGDAIMAIFPREPEDAVRCAIEIQKALQEFNTENLQKGKNKITVGIGIHTGDVILGTLGEEKRMEGTVISDAVNLASRLENLTKLYNASILISMETFLEIEDQENYNFRILDKVKVKGKEQFVTVVEIMDGYEEEKLSRFLGCKIYFEEGVSYYLNKDFDVAMEKFNKVIEIVPDDKAAHIYIQRIEFYKQHGIPLGWDGVEVLDEKFS